MYHTGVFRGGGSLRRAPALQSLYAATSVRQICLQQMPKARLSTKRNEARTMFHTWGRIKVNRYTDWQRIVVRRSVCWIMLHRNSSSRLKKNYHGFGRHVPPVLPMDPPWRSQRTKDVTRRVFGAWSVPNAFVAGFRTGRTLWRSLLLTALRCTS